MFWEREGHFQSTCCPKSWRGGSQELSEQQASPGITRSQLLPQQGGLGGLPETEGLWQPASRHRRVCGCSHQPLEAWGGN